MQKTYLLFFSFILILNLNAQINPESEDEIKSYILSQRNNYDPIIGIYLIKSYQIRSTSKKTEVLEYKNKNPYKAAIVRRNDCFIRLEIPNKVGINYPQCLIYSTSDPDVYFNGKVEFRKNSNGDFESVTEYNQQQIKDWSGLTAKELKKNDYKVSLKTVWTKIFPLQGDIVFETRKPENRNENIVSSGTGFAISNSGLIATNYHVIEGAKSITIKGINQDFNNSFKASVVVTDPINDLAIIKIEDSRFKEFNILPYILRRDNVDVGEDIFVLGYPLTVTMGNEVKLTNGIISSKTGYKGDVSMYQMSAPIQPGNSGGPLFDNQGNIIGIVTAKHTQAENVGYAIKISYLFNLIDLVNPSISLPVSNSISLNSLPEKVKTLKNYVLMIVVNE